MRPQLAFENLFGKGTLDFDSARSVYFMAAGRAEKFLVINGVVYDCEFRLDMDKGETPGQWSIVSNTFYCTRSDNVRVPATAAARRVINEKLVPFLISQITADPQRLIDADINRLQEAVTKQKLVVNEAERLLAKDRDKLEALEKELVSARLKAQPKS